VRYPAIATHDERFRKKGEALHPERYDEKALAQIEKAVGPRVWSALYQQRPSPEEGSYFTNQMITYYDAGEAPTDLTLYAAWDFAITKSDRSDYTVGLLVGVDRAENIWVLDIVRRRMDSMEIVEAMLDMWEEYDIKLMGAEEGHIKHAIGPFLEARVEERRLYDFGVEPLKPGRRDKEMRARSIQGRMAQGRVRFPRDADWTPQVVSELLAFPFGQHDDVVDAFGWIGLMLQEMDHIPDRPNTNGSRRRVPFQTSLASRLKRLGKTARKRDWRVA
jgi:predicted phage terminase large subunit-like protein